MNPKPEQTFRLSPEKRLLVQALLADKGIRPASVTPIRRREPGSTNLLSFAQERLWFLDQLEPNKSLYNVPSAKRLVGRLDIAALEHSLNEIVRRHESLRTHFCSADGVPVLQVRAPAFFPLALTDLGTLPADERLSEARRWAEKEAGLPFDLAVDSLCRARLLRLASEDHVLLLTMHHIISDGWSMGVFFRELASIYNARLHGVPSSLPELAVQYADYAGWQRARLNETLLAHELDYWRKQLAGAPDRLSLPTDRPGRIDNWRSGGVVQFSLSESLTAELRELSRRAGVTLFMTLLATFEILLWRLTGQSDISIGTPIAGRTRSEVEPLIGLFVNTLVLRVCVATHENFQELLARVKNVCLEAYAHQEVPFEKLVDALEVPRILNQHPLFQVMFQLQQSNNDPMQLEGIKVGPLLAGLIEPAKFDLSLTMANTRTGLRGTFSYNTEVIEEETVVGMGRGYEELLRGVVGNSGERVGGLRMMTKWEEEETVRKWNETEVEFGDEELVHEAIAGVAGAEAERVAVVEGEEEVSYGELEERARRLAGYLEGKGVGGERVVGIWLERSVRQLVTVLGILKAGGAYVGIGMEEAWERVVRIIRDSGMELVISEGERAEKLRGLGVEVIVLEGEEEGAEQRAGRASEVGKSRQNLAYVMYTSGTTGEAKGVMIEHGSLMNHTRSAIKGYELGRADVVLQFASLSFDTSGEEIYPALCAGARLVLRRGGMVAGVGEFLRECVEQGVTVLNLPTAYWHEIAAELASGEVKLPGSVRLVIVGGEKLQREGYGEWLGGARLMNSYGPTEATIVATRYEVKEVEAGREIAIGRGIDNVQVYVLDEQQRAVPVGVWGELYIGGAGVARGYWERAELTAERFVPHPYGESGARLYRTGDVCRQRHDGELEYGWRLDQQVKVRGQRVELGEIETALGAQAGVQGAVVRALREAGSELKIVAYVVREPGAELTVAELRRRLGERLPAYMIPAAIVWLDRFPLTPTFKIDYRALPPPQLDQYAEERTVVPPRTAIEHEVAEIWRELLAVDQLSIHDNFFELGGHSLMLTRLASRIRKRFHLEIPLQSLFLAPTVAEIASAVLVRQFAQASSNVSQLVRDLEQVPSAENPN
jgi:amino acid adenylation domain-containing protein